MGNCYYINTNDNGYYNPTHAGEPDLLSNIAKNANPEEIDTISNSGISAYQQAAERVDFHPLSLALIGTYLRDREDVLAEEYLDLLGSYHSKMMDCPIQNSVSVFSIISASVRQLRTDFKLDKGKNFIEHVFRLLSFFLPEDILLYIMPFNSDAKATRIAGADSQPSWVEAHVEAIIGNCPCSTWVRLDWIELEHVLYKYHFLKTSKMGLGTTYSIYVLFLE